jgi:pseudouridine-5'-phosphate glycosidase
VVELNKRKIEGKMVTPFLLSYIYKKTKGKSLDVNISLALNNVRLGAKIAKSLSA